MSIIKLITRMRFSSMHCFIVFRALIPVTRAGSLLEEKRRIDGRTAFDVAIIGAGYAGLACALVLGRHLVSTVIFDGGKTRNARTKRIHGYLGFENASPGALLSRGWSDVLQYSSVAVIRDKVTSLQSRNSQFLISSRRRKFSVKFVLIATGVLDIKPKINGFDKFDGDGAWHCPYCDGHEVEGKRLAIIVSGKKPMAYVKEFLGWTMDITVFPSRVRLSSREREQAAALGIRIVDDTITRIAGRTGNFPKKLFGKKDTYAADVIFYRLGYKVQTRLAEQIGCVLKAGYVKVDGHQQTSVEKVFAAGDIDTDRHYAVLAAASGARAAIAIYEGLLSEAVRGKIKRHKSHQD
jgi:thioredoxin reductase